MFRRIIKSRELNHVSNIAKSLGERNYNIGIPEMKKRVNLGSISGLLGTFGSTKNLGNDSCFHSCKFYNNKHNVASFSTNQRSKISNDSVNSFPGDTDENEVNEDILKEDTELRSLLADIMKDFDAVPPGTEPGGSKSKGVEQNERSAENSNVCIGKLEKCSGGNDNDTTGRKKGVFNLDELIDLLREENLKDIAVIRVPQNLSYCDYLVLATANSIRHLKASTEFIIKTYKSRKSIEDAYLNIEGNDCKDWKVIDMNSIVLHLILSDVRERYDIETLWTVGEKFDDLFNARQNEVEQLLDQHTYYFDDVVKVSAANNNQ